VTAEKSPRKLRPRGLGWKRERERDAPGVQVQPPRAGCTYEPLAAHKKQSSTHTPTHPCGADFQIRGSAALQYK